MPWNNLYRCSASDRTMALFLNFSLRLCNCHSVVHISTQSRTFIRLLSVCRGNSLGWFQIWFWFLLTFLGLCKTNVVNKMVSLPPRNVTFSHSALHQFYWLVSTISITLLKLLIHVFNYHHHLMWKEYMICHAVIGK